MEKPPSTPDMSARETEDMVNSMLLDSPLPDTKRSDEKPPEDGGSDKLPGEDGEKLPEGGGNKQPEEALQVSLWYLVGKIFLYCS